VLFLIEQVLVVVSLLCPILLLCLRNGIFRLLHRVAEDSDDVLDVEQQRLLVFLVGCGVLVGLVDFLQVAHLVREEFLYFLHSVVKGVVLFFLDGSGVQIVKKLDKTLVKLSNFDV